MPIFDKNGKMREGKQKLVFYFTHEFIDGDCRHCSSEVTVCTAIDKITT
jgi:hypothetical protein